MCFMGLLTSTVVLAKLRAALGTGGARCVLLGFWKTIATLVAPIIGL